MDGEENPESAKRSQPNEGGFEPDDDEPIGYLFKLKRPRISIKPKLDMERGGERRKKAGIKGGKLVLEDGDFLGMDDTLANFRKKLKVSKKNIGTAQEQNPSSHTAEYSNVSTSELVDLRDPNAGLPPMVKGNDQAVGDVEPGATMDASVERKRKVKGMRLKDNSNLKTSNDYVECNNGAESLGSGCEALKDQEKMDISLMVGPKHFLDEHLEGSLPVFSQKAQSGLSSRSLTLPNRKQTSKADISEAVSNPKLEVVSGTNESISVNGLGSLAFDSPQVDGHLNYDSSLLLVSGLCPLNSASAGVIIVEDKRLNENFPQMSNHIEMNHNENRSTSPGQMIEKKAKKYLRCSNVKDESTVGLNGFDEFCDEESKEFSNLHLRDGCPHSEKDITPKLNDGLKHCTARKTKKPKHGNRAYEEDADWEILTDEYVFLENHHTMENDHSFKERRDSCLSIDNDVGNGGAAAISVGLKAHAVGHIEKIKFKEVLKRKGGLQEYLECRNLILDLWFKDVSRILPLVDCGITDTISTDGDSHSSLIREIYSFLDQGGYINFGIASEKDTSNPNNSYTVLKDRKNKHVTDSSAADAEDGVSFITGHIQSSEVATDAKNSVTFDVEEPFEATRGREFTSVENSELQNVNEVAEHHACLEDNSVIVKESSTLISEYVSNSNISSDIIDCKSLLSSIPDLKNGLPSIGSGSESLKGGDYYHQPDAEVGKRIIVIGAGPAGLTAARHLQRQGFTVIILEARSRIGGRVHTDRSTFSVPVDLGASIITGVEADVATDRRPDPSSLVCAQLGLELTVLNSDCPLYDTVTCQRVPLDLDEALEAEYNSLLDDMVLIVAQKGEHSMKMSLEEGLEYALERRRMAQLGRDIEEKILKSSTDTLSSCKSVPESKCFKAEILSPLERRVMDWHFANLEYGCAALLKEVSLPHWNQDDVYGGFGGAHCMIKGGYSTVIESLGEGLCVHLNHLVTDISYDLKIASPHDDPTGEVQVSTSNGSVFLGDAVLVTVPLGCLKAETIKFSPPLPQWKHSSIQRLGFGVLNKVVLEFPEVFWDDSVDYFGATADQTNRRGQCFMFWNVRKTVGAPVLIALLVGKAAVDGQNLSSSDHINHALMVLRKLFGEALVPDPVASAVTDWGKDPLSYGAYSYVAVGASGEDYDILARPIGNCLFFAGEATCKEHPDTVGGAMMSGLREAVRIINVLRTGYDCIAEVEETEASQRQSDGEKDEYKDILRKLGAVELSNDSIMTREDLLQNMFFNAKTMAGRLCLAKELLKVSLETLKSFAGTKEGLTVLNFWILDSMGKDGTQLLRHCLRLLVLVSTDLLAIRLSGIGKTVKEKVCVHTSRDIRAIASQLVNVWLEVFRKEKASNGGMKLRPTIAVDSSKRKYLKDSSRKPPFQANSGGLEAKSVLQTSSTAGSHLPSNEGLSKSYSKPLKQDLLGKTEISSSRSKGSLSEVDAEEEGEDAAMSEEEQVAFAAAEAARAALAAAEAHAFSEAKCNTTLQLPKIPSFHKFARREQYGQRGEYDIPIRFSGSILGKQDSISEIDSRNCKVRNWSVDFSATCVNPDSSRLSVDNLSLQSHSNELISQINCREHSGESMAVDSSIYTKAWVDTSGSEGVKDYHDIERWQSQAAAASNFFWPHSHTKDEEDSNATLKEATWNNKVANDSSVSQVTMSKEYVKDYPRGAEKIKQAVVDYVATLLMPLYQTRKIDKEGYKSIMKKSATKVMERATDAEKAMAVHEFLDLKRRNKIRPFVDKLIERHIAMNTVGK